MLRRSDDVIGQTLYPSSSVMGGRIKVDPVDGSLDTYACRQCGSWLRPDLGVQSSGAANDGDGFVVNDTTTGDPVVNQGGCWFCGSANNR